MVLIMNKMRFVLAYAWEEHGDTRKIEALDTYLFWAALKNVPIYGRWPVQNVIPKSSFFFKFKYLADEMFSRKSYFFNIGFGVSVRIRNRSNGNLYNSSDVWKTFVVYVYKKVGNTAFLPRKRGYLQSD